MFQLLNKEALRVNNIGHAATKTSWACTVVNIYVQFNHNYVLFEAGKRKTQTPHLLMNFRH